MNRSRLLLLIVLAVAWTGCGRPMGKVYLTRSTDRLDKGGSKYLSDNGRPVLWDRATKAIEFAFDSGFPAEFTDSCRSAGETLNAAIGRPLIRFSDEARDYSQTPDGFNVISFGKSEASTKPGHEGEAQVSFTDNRITEADIDLDTRHFQFSSTGEADKADVESVCLHELGHALGLAHSQDPTSVMFPSLSVGTQKRVLSAEDARVLRNVYGVE
jgi:hypothetical protein